MYVEDNFLKDPTLIQAVKEDTTFFPEVMNTINEHNEDLYSAFVGNMGGSQGLLFHSEESSCFAPYMFWDGWWNSPADTLKKQVIQKIWEHQPIRNFNLEDVVGFEYWTRTLVPPQYLAHHVDEDTFLYANNKGFNAPIAGSIWYGFTDKETEGGMLEIHQPTIQGFPTGVLEEEPLTEYRSPKDQLERIAYAPNRLVVFDVGRRLHGTTPLLSGIRQVMVVNVWPKNKPPLALQTGEFYYES